VDRRAWPTGLPQYLTPHSRIDADVDAAVLFEDELIEFQRAVANALGGLKVGEPVDMEIRCKAKRVR
jgi:hypothetical protein